MNNKKDYYVYEYIRLDNNSVFYVGKGKDKRIYGRKNKHAEKIINKVPTACYIVKDNLTEDEAHQLECYLIYQYVFEEGYGINTKGNKIESGMPYLTNMTWGGEGSSGIIKSEKTIKKLKASCKTSSKIWYANLDEETKKEYLRKSKEATILKMKEPEVRKKMSEAGMGTKNNRSKGGVYIIHKKQIKFYENLKEASKEFEISPATLSQLANSKKEYFSKKDEKKHLNGLICIYGNDYKLLEI